MEITQILLLNIILILAFPLALLLARTTKEELKDGRKAFIALIVFFIIALLVSLILRITNESRTLVVYAALFVIILSSISLNKSYKKGKKTK